MTINDATLRTLLDLRDDLGIVSVLAGFAPDHAGKPTAPIRVRNLLRDVRGTLDGDVGAAFDRRVGELGDDLAGVLDPAAAGRGRALYLGLASGELHHVNVQLPFEERVVVRDRAYVRPLVAAIDEGRPAGIAAVTSDAVRVMEWTLGDTRELAVMDFELGDAQLADQHRGPGPGATGQTSTSHREQFEDRIDSNRQRFLKSAANTLGDFVAQRSWDRLVVAGPARARDLLRQELQVQSEVLEADAQWDQLSVGQVAQEAWPVVRSHHRARERALVDEIREAANAGGAAALGATRICNAVNQGRVAHLLFADDAEMSGYRSPSMGTLHADMEGTAAVAGEDLTPVRHLVEALVERTLATGGRVTRVDDEDARSGLAAYHGLGARLRW